MRHGSWRPCRKDERLEVQKTITEREHFPLVWSGTTRARISTRERTARWTARTNTNATSCTRRPHERTSSAFCWSIWSRPSSWRASMCVRMIPFAFSRLSSNKRNARKWSSSRINRTRNINDWTISATGVAWPRDFIKWWCWVNLARRWTLTTPSVVSIRTTISAKSSAALSIEIFDERCKLYSNCWVVREKIRSEWCWRCYRFERNEVQTG